MKGQSNNMSKANDGAMCELAACAFLLKKGYEVFRNVSPQGPIDIVGFKEGQFRKFDVKKSYITELGGVQSRESCKTPKQSIMGVEILYVDNDLRCYFSSEVKSQIVDYYKENQCINCLSKFSITLMNQRQKKYCSDKCSREYFKKLK